MVRKQERSGRILRKGRGPFGNGGYGKIARGLFTRLGFSTEMPVDENVHQRVERGVGITE